MNIIEKLLTVNPYSNPNKPLNKVKAIVIHWVANPKSSAEANRNFFENRKYGKTNYGSAHFIVEGMKVIQCLPLNRLAYHVGSATYTQSALRNLSTYPNNCTIGIELTHQDATGKPDDITYLTTIKLVADLCKKFGLTEKNVWTHQQVVGWKPCHKYYVDNPKAWVKFISDVAVELNGKSIIIPTPKEINVYDLIMVKNLGHGDKGEDVKKLQLKLNQLGYSVGAVDGIFGDQTDAALEKFQNENGLTVDGIAGDKTLSKIEELLKNSKGARKLDLNKRQLHDLANILSVANNRGIFSSREHVEKMDKGEMTVDESIYLFGLLVGELMGVKRNQ